MAYLTAAVVVVGLLCLLDLLLTLGVIRRLREHTSKLAQLASGLSAGFPEELGVPVGEAVAGFAATATGGGLVSRELLAGRTLVGFFAPGCGPCEEQLPGFVEYAQSLPGGPGQAVAVVVGGDGAQDTKGSEYVERLDPVAQVVVEAPGGPVQSAFRVNGYPTLYLVDIGGVVVAGGMSMRALENVPVSPIAETATV
jgi:thiol-disulfide isomerase/thioredoxin